MNTMNTLQIFEILNKDIKLNYNSKTEFSTKIGITKQRMSNIMQILKSNKEKNSFNVVCSILEKAGYEITIKKKEV